jgi:Flp pilus assembly protein TadG
MNLAKSQSGQSLVEFALIFTVIALFIFGIIDFGRILNAKLILDHASREAARSACVGMDDTTVQQVITEDTSELNGAAVTTNITPGYSSRIRGVYVTVSIAYPVTISTPLVAQIIPNPFIVKGETVMRVE